MQTNIHLLSYPTHFFLEWEIFQTKSIQNKHSSCSVTFFRKSCHLWDNVETFCTAVQATDDNMTQAHCILDTKRYKHTLRMCNTLFFPNNKDCTNVPESYVVRTLFALCKIEFRIVCGAIYTIQYNTIQYNDACNDV
jgi:hypothetical protein